MAPVRWDRPQGIEIWLLSGRGRAIAITPGITLVGRIKNLGWRKILEGIVRLLVRLRLRTALRLGFGLFGPGLIRSGSFFRIPGFTHRRRKFCRLRRLRWLRFGLGRGGRNSLWLMAAAISDEPGRAAGYQK